MNVFSAIYRANALERRRVAVRPRLGHGRHVRRSPRSLPTSSASSARRASSRSAAATTSGCPTCPGYLGVDVAPEAIARARLNHPDRRYLVIDAVKGQLPDADLVIVRDVLQHLPARDGVGAARPRPRTERALAPGLDLRGHDGRLRGVRRLLVPGPARPALLDAAGRARRARRLRLRRGGRRARPVQVHRAVGALDVCVLRPARRRATRSFATASARSPTCPTGASGSSATGPPGCTGVEHVPGNRAKSTEANAVDNLRLACEAVDADRFVVMNDDFYVMSPLRRVPVAARGPVSTSASRGRAAATCSSSGRRGRRSPATPRRSPGPCTSPSSSSASRWRTSSRRSAGADSRPSGGRCTAT